MNRTEALIRRVERDAAVIVVLQDILTTLRILQLSGCMFDVRPDIEKIMGALTLLGFPE